jgi:hypothetical protein
MQQDNFQVDQHSMHTEIKPIKWTLYMFVTSIPFVGLIMLFVWAFGSDNNVTRRNWAKGALIFGAILLAFYLLIFLIFGAAIMAAASSGNEYGY